MRRSVVTPKLVSKGLTRGIRISRRKIASILMDDRFSGVRMALIQRYRCFACPCENRRRPARDEMLPENAGDSLSAQPGPALRQSPKTSIRRPGAGRGWFLRYSED